MAFTCDTSVVVSALVTWHPLHEAARRRMMRDVVAIPAHVVFECFSVLTRLPAPHRLEASVAADAVGRLQRPLLELPATEVLALIAAMTHGSVFGGATYDGIVGATARHHEMVLITADRRARTTYDALGVRYDMI